MADLANRSFRLLQNVDGQATADTVMHFGPERHPYKAEYSGPNITYGHAIAHDSGVTTKMLYHAIDLEGQLTAGKADVILVNSPVSPLMVLNWQWLTDDRSAGLSIWQETTPD
jgi:hypothetical protein